MHATWRRNAPAVKALLQLGMDPNGGDTEVTPLDCISWTREIPQRYLDATARDLTKVDAEIASLLRAHGGVRGTVFKLEYQALTGFAGSFIIPFT
jgi:hypothetical protein